MMARVCDGCDKIIEQKDNEFLHVWIIVRDTTEGNEQDSKAQSYGDFCDMCVSNGTAIKKLVEPIEWKFEL